MMQVKHYILTNDGRITEFSTEEAFKVANGLSALPQFADTRQRYIQVQYDEPEGQETDKLQVKIAGAYVSFDAAGKLREAGSPADGEEPISRFEHDTCVQLALKGAIGEAIILH